MINLNEERQKRNTILKALQAERRVLVQAGREVARYLFQSYGKPVTAGDVYSFLESTEGEAFLTLLRKHDKRWLGAVFVYGWQKVGYEYSGSHCRPVALWVPEEKKESFSSEHKKQ